MGILPKLKRSGSATMNWLLASMWKKRTIRVVIGLAVSVFFLWLLFSNDEIVLEKIRQAVSEISALWLIPAVLVYFLGVWVRTTRWCILLRPVIRTTTTRLFPVYVISYMVNNVLPLRIGDIYRAYIAGRKERISKSAALVTIGVERIFDGLTMLALLVISVMFFPIEDARVAQAVYLGSLVFLSAIVICYLLVVNKKWAEWVFNKILFLTKTSENQRIRDLFDNLFHGLDSLKSGRDILSIVTLSFATWLIEASSYYMVLNAFGFFGSFIAAIATMALVNLMIIVPSAPGYFGPFELACFIILGKSGYGEMTGFTENTAIAYALILHVVVQWIPSTLLGLVYMWREHIRFKDIESEVNI